MCGNRNNGLDETAVLQVECIFKNSKLEVLPYECQVPPEEVASKNKRGRD